MNEQQSIKNLIMFSKDLIKELFCFLIDIKKKILFHLENLLQKRKIMRSASYYMV